MDFNKKINHQKIALIAVALLYCSLSGFPQPGGLPEKMRLSPIFQGSDTLNSGAGLISNKPKFNPFELLKKQSKEKFDIVYDMRQTPWLTPVKTQSNNGCWAYSTMGSLESRWLKLGYPVFDLSDNNLKYCHNYVPERSYWGNHWMSTSYFVRGSGPMTEAQDPYPGGTPGPDQCIDGLTPVAYIPDSRYLPKNMDLMKQAILDYGAIFSMMYINTSYYNPVNYTYYYPGSSINHATCIAGWNDTLTTSGGTGAWICKNTYGPGWGDGGYFYISYNDGALLNYNCYWPNRWDYDTLVSIYQHDEIGGYDGLGWNDSLCYALVKFQAETDLEILKLGTFMLSSNMKVDFRIFDNFDGSLTGLLGQKNQTTYELPGYYTIDLDSSIKIEAGNDFYVLAGFNSSTLSNIWPIPIEDTITGYSHPFIESGKCWINPNFSLYPTYWFPIGADQPGWEFDICMKVFTKPLNKISGTISYNNQSSTPLTDIRVFLLNESEMIVDSTLSNENGNFVFQMIPQGNYTLEPNISTNPGGINATDALLAQLHSIAYPGYILEGLPGMAADVNMDGNINATDALFILQRTIDLITEFPAGDWQIASDTVFIHGNNVFPQIKVQFTGDINASYNFPGYLKSNR